ncbi:MAG: hypothetical protein U9Q40_03135 [Campylobacterota bacterium]|nr:hypothetical protein [Campylobacterota bacterium]
MNIKEFKEWLNNFPDDAEVHVPVVFKAHDWSLDETRATEFEGEEFCDYEFMDFTKNAFVTENYSFFGKKILVLGEES